jgi:hypothetical protein
MAGPFKPYKGKYSIHVPAVQKASAKKKAAAMPQTVKNDVHHDPLTLTRYPYKISDGTKYFMYFLVLL